MSGKERPSRYIIAGGVGGVGGGWGTWLLRKVMIHWGKSAHQRTCGLQYKGGPCRVGSLDIMGSCVVAFLAVVCDGVDFRCSSHVLFPAICTCVANRVHF